MSIKLLELVREPDANDHLPVPYTKGEKVEYKGELDDSYQPETFRKQFIKVYRFKSKRTETISRKNFKKLGKWEYDN